VPGSARATSASFGSSSFVGSEALSVGPATVAGFSTVELPATPEGFWVAERFSDTSGAFGAEPVGGEPGTITTGGFGFSGSRGFGSVTSGGFGVFSERGRGVSLTSGSS
jgi:hypothetical protein